MQLSDLQRFILKRTYKESGKVSRRVFDSFYSKKTKAEKAELDAITRSLERLITKGLLVAYGHKTAEKFFIGQVLLTPRGKKIAHELRLRDQRLPLR